MTGSYPITLPNISAILQGDNGALANAVINAPDGAMLLYQNKQRQDAQIRDYLGTLKDSNLAQRVLANREMDIQQQHHQQDYLAKINEAIAPQTNAGIPATANVLSAPLITPAGGQNVAAAALGKQQATTASALKDTGQGLEAGANAGYITKQPVDLNSSKVPTLNLDPASTVKAAVAAILGNSTNTTFDKDGNPLMITKKGPGPGGMPGPAEAIEQDRAVTPQEKLGLISGVPDENVKKALQSGNTTKQVTRNQQGQPVNNYHVTYQSNGRAVRIVIQTDAQGKVLHVQGE